MSDISDIACGNSRAGAAEDDVLISDTVFCRQSAEGANSLFGIFCAILANSFFVNSVILVSILQGSVARVASVVIFKAQSAA